MVAHPNRLPESSSLGATTSRQPSLLARWPSWAGYAAATWSLVFSAFGCWWAFGGSLFPFGRSDPRADEVGSLFGWAQPETLGVALSGTGIVGCLVALAMCHEALRNRSWLPMTFALMMSVLLIIIIPDIRVVQNFAYLFFAYTGKWDWPLFFMLFCMVGGVLWAATAVAYHRKTRRLCAHCGRNERDASSARQWGTWSTNIAALMAMPYPITRISWALGIPLGIPASEIADSSLGLRVGEAMLGGLFIGGAILTLGLVRPWGEVFPQWIPRLGGRRVPVWFAVAPAIWSALVLTQAGLRIAIWTLTDEEPITTQNWGMGGPGLFWMPFGVALGIATYAYYLRRRGACHVCGRGSGDGAVSVMDASAVQGLLPDPERHAHQPDHIAVGRRDNQSSAQGMRQTRRG